jgi:hypothetical protein
LTDSLRAVILYTCGQKKAMASLGHACGRAAKALDQAGYEYEIRPLPGYRLLPWTWEERRKGRAEIQAMTGQINLPVLLLDEDRAIVGSGEIVDWARAHPRTQPEVGGG